MFLEQVYQQHRPVTYLKILMIFSMYKTKATHLYICLETNSPESSLTFHSNGNQTRLKSWCLNFSWGNFSAHWVSLFQTNNSLFFKIGHNHSVLTDLITQELKIHKQLFSSYLLFLGDLVFVFWFMKIVINKVWANTYCWYLTRFIFVFVFLSISIFKCCVVFNLNCLLSGN